ncbi:hypothetical protein D8B26_005013 [Coccidioides posadasii str. Silveira]|uniref:Uncharacterized protein n=1 Tax=Coccidioides posadasii (strain RMSCC 757 / Silveira) TaxID=443226 RepID=E9D5H6_COCPS|nr:conserved hypothetical protein [Coccidioides posadasii str. Silveira]QVM10353.1 hypothetical protein D8B26_005013 [Coccidioides posadasii str. Silveira]
MTIAMKPGHEFAVFKGTKSGKVVRDITRRAALQGNEVLVRVTHSGLCGSDLHYRHSGCVLGHEGVGVVSEVGPNVLKLREGDRVGWGYLQNSCAHCKQCINGHQIHCPDLQTFGNHNKDQGSMGHAAIWTEPFLFRIPESITSADAAPLMCAGATVFSIFDQYNIRPTDRVGILGLGGLGHIAVQFSKHMGCQTVVFSGTNDKKNEALALGADEFYPTHGVEEFKDIEPVDHLIVTTSAQVDWALYLPVLAPRSSVYPLTVAFGDFTIPYMPLLRQGLKIVGSIVASVPVHQRMIEFAARHNIKPTVELFDMDEEGIERAMDRLAEGKIRYRAVLVAPEST